MSEVFASLELGNGLVVRFVDQSNRYFGDYHRVSIRVVIALPDEFELPEGMKREKACLEKNLEKMGVPTASVETERRALVDGFLKSSRAYLEKDNFPQQLLAKLQKEKTRPVFLRGQ